MRKSVNSQCHFDEVGLIKKIKIQSARDAREKWCLAWFWRIVSRHARIFFSVSAFRCWIFFIRFLSLPLFFPLADLTYWFCMRLAMFLQQQQQSRKLDLPSCCCLCIRVLCAYGACNADSLSALGESLIHEWHRQSDSLPAFFPSLLTLHFVFACSVFNFPVPSFFFF